MRILHKITIILLVLVMHQQLEGQHIADYQTIRNSFQNPAQTARPKVYWWCLNGNIDTLRARQELHAMKALGISGFDLFEIGVQEADTMIHGGPAFMSDPSIQLIKFVVDEAGKLGLSVGLNLASSWNAGGNWVKPEHGGKSIYASRTTLKGGSRAKKISIPFPEISFPKESLVGGNGDILIPFRDNGRPEYYEDIAVLALPAGIEEGKLDTADIVDVTSFFNPETDELKWKAPAGEWEICRYVCSNSGQQVVLPSTHSAGLTIDHFDSTAVETHLLYFINRLLPVLGDFRNTALETFYLASYEARGLVWTSTLPQEFRKINTYSIRKFIPSFFQPELYDEETRDKIQNDFKKTLSELMINNLYKKSQEVCSRYGLKINSEAGGPGYPLYNGPAEPLKAQGSIDIPRGEFWINHSRFYKNGNDSIDILRVVKEASAASHIYGKGIVEEEAFTSFMHWQEGPFDMKPFGDRAFCEGMNRVVIHGFSHNVSNSGFPGYAYYAGTHFNDKRVWWPKAKPFLDYLSRISAVFQESDFQADVLWYYGDKVPNAATHKNAKFKVAPGTDYEVINTEVLLEDLSVENGRLVLSGGAEFRVLALENEEDLNPEIRKKLDELATQGAVIVRQKTKKADHLISRNELKDLGIQADIDYSGSDSELIDFIHYSRNELDFYFIRNTQNDWLSRSIKFRQQDKSPEIWDPVTGEIAPVHIFEQEDGYTSLPVTLSPYGSLIIAFSESSRSPQYTSASGAGTFPPFLIYTSNGIVFLQEGDFSLEGPEQSVQVQNRMENSVIDGPWDVAFTPGWGAPETAVFPNLISWTDSEDDGIKYYSGTATYKKVFRYDMKPEKAEAEVFLDLGEISKVAEVWLNGEALGISWAKPHRFDVSRLLKQGENTLIIEIANVWSNRITGDAILGQKFTNTNIKATMIPAPTMETGDQKRYPWAEVPLIKSGLMGPVSINISYPLRIEE